MVTYYEMILWYLSSDYIGLELSVTARLETITRCQNLTVDPNSSKFQEKMLARTHTITDK